MNFKLPKTIPFLFVFIIIILILPGHVSALSWVYGLRWFYVIALAFLISFVITPVSMYIAHKFGILDYPNERKLHNNPMPRIGGLAVFIATAGAAIRNCQFSNEVIGLLIASSVIYLLGLADDIKGLPVTFRLIVQLAASAIAIGSGIRITFVPHIPGEILLETIITLIWFLGLANAFNFLDGIDGLVAGMGLICALFFFAITWPTGQSYVTYFTLALAGACLGFLPYNWKPASVFLGDAGATFIGFVVANLAVMGSWAQNQPIVALSTPLLILGIPIFDMIYTTASRMHNGSIHTVKQWLEFVGRDHFHHRLLKLGLNEYQTVGFMLGVNVCLGLGALVIRRTADSMGAMLLLAQEVLVFGIIVVLMLLGRQTTESDIVQKSK